MLLKHSEILLGTLSYLHTFFPRIFAQSLFCLVLVNNITNATESFLETRDDIIETCLIKAGKLDERSPPKPCSQKITHMRDHWHDVETDFKDAPAASKYLVKKGFAVIQTSIPRDGDTQHLPLVFSECGTTNNLVIKYKRKENPEIIILKVATALKQFLKPVNTEEKPAVEIVPCL